MWSTSHHSLATAAERARAMSDVEFATVTQALAAITAELPAIGKDDRSPAVTGGYSYRGVEAITRHLQPLLAKHGVVIAPRATISQVVPSPAMKEGWQDVHMTVEWLIAGPDGSTIVAQTTGIGRDNSDKGAPKAQTQAYKYLLLHLFCISDGKDDADSQSYEHERSTEPEVMEARARDDGWDSVEQREAEFQRLQDVTNALPEDERRLVVSDVTKAGVNAWLSREQATWWAGLIAVASPRDGVEPRGIEGNQNQEEPAVTS